MPECMVLVLVHMSDMLLSREHDGIRDINEDADGGTLAYLVEC